MRDLQILSVYLSIRVPTLDIQTEFVETLIFGSKALDGSEFTYIEL